ncbi:uncharacterized protein DNG_02913 [Cephalotrichum gorgonifer]|uniref:DNA (cytosine-5-)-methyltransferase n=1 Tax=Cephalotrichum gorgonifer TaxID=2041049 RepID=A0AAE8MU44_9PEZI|nr:uncharacterized protein DNG_02913 [Cephalotrichum gorgonifer]
MNSFPGTDPANSWVIDDDDEQEVTVVDAEISRWVQELRQATISAPPLIELDNDDVVELESLAEKEIFDLTRDDDVASGPPARRNPDVASLGLRLADVTWRGMHLKEGGVVQINSLPQHPLRYTYLRIKEIYQPTQQAGQLVKIRGLPYIKSVHLGGLLKWHRREVVAVYDIDRDDDRGPEVQALVEVQISDVLAIRTLVTTNTPYPEHSEDGVIVCRWKHLRYWPSAKFRESSRTTVHPGYEAAIVSITPEEADGPFRIDGESLRRRWRGEVVLGGSYRPTSGGESPTAPIELEEPTYMNHGRRVWDRARRQVRIPGQKYTFFDSFSGAGGASRGAVKAGLKPMFAVDHWAPACNSYRRNFPMTDVFETDVSDFMNLVVDPRADVLHLSPPCQVFSPAHTVPSEAKDAANLASLFGCEAVLKKVKPRIFTLEQTFGLMMARWSPYFNHLIGTFTAHGYSVRWRIVPLADWGLPALRKRLIIIGAGPGEKLLPFPEPSHSAEGRGRSGSRVKPYVTAKEAINRIRARRGVDPLHNPRAMKRLNYAPWNGDSILPRCITTSGGQNYHFSGAREFTLREFATLQGFPVYHAFEGPYIKKQIGNAFPPVVAEHLFRHIQSWLLEEDGITLAEPGLTIPDHSFVIDEDADAILDALVVDDDSGDEDDGIAWLFGGRDDGGLGNGRDAALENGRHDVHMVHDFVDISSDDEGTLAGVAMDVDTDDSEATLGRGWRGNMMYYEVLVVD